MSSEIRMYDGLLNHIQTTNVHTHYRPVRPSELWPWAFVIGFCVGFLVACNVQG